MVESQYNMSESPEKYHWKKSYTLVLVANVVYVLAFYIIMQFFA